ncbi:MAG: sensor histidine kinase [Peptostreptococcaceae bacterium]|jgi:two-component system sensor histidine kinase DegS|nr:sensor histidine kinase [Peptostreptococcaceae bacterium]
MDNKIVKNEDVNKVLSKVLESIKEGQNELFSITENIRQESTGLKVEMEEIKLKSQRIIKQVDELEIKEKASRKRLFMVSKNFDKYSENDIKRAYEEARDIQIQLILKREEEKNLIKRRNDLEIRYRKNKDMVNKTEGFISKMSSAVDFLIGDLEKVNQTLSDLEDKSQIGMKIIKAQEEERRRIARDIHDGPAQSLATLVIRSQVMTKIMEQDVSMAKEEVDNMREILKATLKEIRRIMYDLRPMSIDDLGLVATLNRLITDVRYEKGIDINLVILNNEEVFSPLLRLTVYRIFQEAITNACKHSQTKEIKIKLDINKFKVNGIVQDFGIGFDPSKIKEKKESFGLSSMKERVNLLNGELKIDSTKNVGTSIVFTFPNEEVRYE